ncbi:MAG: hypothetical protein AAFX07_05760 [Pseudomonadota bacterium]
MALNKPQILCGTCMVAAIAPENPSASDELRCPNCNRADTVEKAVEDARWHATHTAKRALEKRMIEDGETVRNITPTRAPIKNLRWISNLQV